jgi:hypothetical protein
VTLTVQHRRYALTFLVVETMFSQVFPGLGAETAESTRLVFHKRVGNRGSGVSFICLMVVVVVNVDRCYSPPSDEKDTGEEACINIWFCPVQYGAKTLGCVSQG